MKKLDCSSKIMEFWFLFCNNLYKAQWRIAIVLIFLFSGQLSAQSYSTRGTEFWLSFIENLDLMGNGQPKFSFFISCDITTNGAITIPTTGYTQPFTATAGQVTEVFLPAGIFYPIGSEQVGQFGVLITSQQPISVGAQHHRLYFSDASIVLPVTELSSSYRVITHKDDSGTGGLSEFVVVATDDNTIVDIVPSVITKLLKPPGVPITITLQKGEVYQVQSYEDLTGSSVNARAGKKIAVFSGATSATVECDATNHLYDQNFPINRWGNEYVLMPLAAGATDVFRVLAQENGTLIYQNCQQPILLDKGEYHDFQSAVPFRITSTHAIGVGQFKKGQECTALGDCTFMLNAPVSFNSKNLRFSSLQTAIVSAPQYTQHNVNIIIRTANAVPVYLDNNLVTFFPFSSDPAYSYARVSVSAGAHSLVSDSSFYAFASGFGQYDGYSYFLGYDDKHKLIKNVTIEGPDYLCIDSAGKYSGVSPLSVASWSWNFGDESSSDQQSLSHSFSHNGNYTITLLAVDSAGCTYVAEHYTDVACADMYSECEIFVPTAFSPNGNGIDDYECVYGACIGEMEYTIFDSWGELVFKTTNQTQCWDGTYKGGQLDNAVFTWTLSATLYSGKKIMQEGNVTLIK